MGRLLTRGPAGSTRTLIALLLTLVAIALPSAAFYVAGSRSVEREREDLHTDAMDTAQELAGVQAAKLSTRLRALIEVEDRRPFYHYQNLYHDPRGAHQGASVVPSPLRSGAADPLIRTHFQIDPGGRVSLPALNEDVPEMSCANERESYVQMRRLLGPAAPFCCDDDVKDADAIDRPRPVRIVLDAEAWEQNLRASKLYADLKRDDAEPWPEASFRRAARRQVEVFVEPLRWRTVPLETGPALVALRRVDTPVGRLVQGFTICPEALRSWLMGTQLPTRVTTEPRPHEVTAAIDLRGTRWTIAVDPAEVLAEAATLGRVRSRGFQRLFLVCVLAAGLAGLSVVLMVRQTERLAHERSRFAASAAHELRTPLASIRMYSEMIADALGDPSKHRDYARRASAEAERLGRVVRNVLGFSRLERGEIAVRPVEGDILEAVAACIETQRPALERSGSRIVLEAEKSLPGVRFDPDALCQILQNLLDNAEKFGRSSADRRIDVRLRSSGGRVLLEVADRGPGIAPHERARVFRPFGRAAGDGAPEGLGLGLALVRNLVELHGGSISYHDREGGGALLTVSLPATSRA